MAKSYSEADMGSMKGYSPNLGLPKSKVANSGYTPKTGPMAPRRVVNTAGAPRRGMPKGNPRMGMVLKQTKRGPMQSMNIGRMKNNGAQGNAASTAMTAGMQKAQSAFNRMVKR